MRACLLAAEPLRLFVPATRTINGASRPTITIAKPVEIGQENGADVTTPVLTGGNSRYDRSDRPLIQEPSNGSVMIVTNAPAIVIALDPRRVDDGLLCDMVRLFRTAGMDNMSRRDKMRGRRSQRRSRPRF